MTEYVCACCNDSVIADLVYFASPVTQTASPRCVLGSSYCWNNSNPSTFISHTRVSQCRIFTHGHNQLKDSRILLHSYGKPAVLDTASCVAEETLAPFRMTSWRLWCNRHARILHIPARKHKSNSRRMADVPLWDIYAVNVTVNTETQRRERPPDKCGVLLRKKGRKWVHLW
jgi:hypothetical protein